MDKYICSKVLYVYKLDSYLDLLYIKEMYIECIKKWVEKARAKGGSQCICVCKIEILMKAHRMQFTLSINCFYKKRLPRQDSLFTLFGRTMS